jgi:hypothetical protein
MSRKEASFKQLLSYINKPKHKGKTALLYNFQNFSDKLKQVENEFLKNYEFAPKRKNGNALYHEIISFSEKDRKFLTESILHDLAFEYLQMRAQGALAYAKVHFDKKCSHVHVVISANLIKSRQKLRITKGQFGNIKKKLEKYQQKEYPFLENSIVFSKTKKERIKQTVKEGERERRIKNKREKSRKEQIADIVKNCLCIGSEKEFLEKLKTEGLKFYVRGKNVGVQETSKMRKFRLKTLGVASDYLKMKKRWQRANKREFKTELIEIERELQRWNEIFECFDNKDELERRTYKTKRQFQRGRNL